MSATFLCSLYLIYLPLLTLLTTPFYSPDSIILLAFLALFCLGFSHTYLSDRTQVVFVNGASSTPAALSIFFLNSKRDRTMLPDIFSEQPCHPYVLFSSLATY